VAVAAHGMVEIVDLKIYDTLAVPINEAAPVALFASPVGVMNGGKVKLSRDTNMHMGSVLPTPQSMTVSRILCAFLRKGLLTSPFSDSVWARSYLRFSIGTKTYADGQPWMFAHPACLLGTKDFSAMVNVEDRARVFESICRPLTRTLNIRTQEFFEGVLTVPDNQDDSLEFVLMLEGELVRMVQ
jgi:hypothetical protein